MVIQTEMLDSDPQWQQLRRELAIVLTQPAHVGVVVVASDEADAHRLWLRLTHVERTRVAIYWAQVRVLSGHPHLVGITQAPPADPPEDAIQRDLTYD